MLTVVGTERKILTLFHLIMVELCPCAESCPKVTLKPNKPHMTKERYNYLMNSLGAELTEEEIQQGYHFCQDYDGLLVGPESPEIQNCTCE